MGFIVFCNIEQETGDEGTDTVFCSDFGGAFAGDLRSGNFYDAAACFVVERLRIFANVDDCKGTSALIIHTELVFLVQRKRIDEARKYEKSYFIYCNEP